MVRRYKEITEDSRFPAVEDRGQYLNLATLAAKTNVFYLPIFLQNKRSLRNLNKKITNNDTL